MSSRSQRLAKAMNMRADGPTLVPVVRTRSFIDYNQLSSQDKAKYSRNCEDFLATQTIRCKTDNDYFKCVASLREKRRVLSLKGDLIEAGRVDNLIQQLSDYFIENSLYTSKAQFVDVVNYQLSSQRQRLCEAEERWEAEIEVAKEDYAKELEKCGIMSRKILDNYDASMPEVLPTEYSKLSSDLLNLKEKEKHLIGSRRFDEANRYHKEFETRKTAELNAKKLEYFNASEKRRAQIEKTNGKKESALIEHWTRKIKEIEAARDKEIKPLEMAISALERKYKISKSEYVGEDDPIPEEVVFETKKVNKSDLTAAGTFRSRNLVSLDSTITPKTVSSSKPGRSLVGNERPVKRSIVDATDKQRTEVLKKQGTKLNSSRWPK